VTENTKSKLQCLNSQFLGITPPLLPPLLVHGLGNRRRVFLWDKLGHKACSAAHLFVAGGGLALLVEGHDHAGRPMALDHAGVFLEGLLPLLQADGVDDALALTRLQPGLHYVELQGKANLYYFSMEHNTHGIEESTGVQRVAQFKPSHSLNNLSISFYQNPAAEINVSTVINYLVQIGMHDQSGS